MTIRYELKRVLDKWFITDTELDDELQKKADKNHAHTQYLTSQSLDGKADKNHVHDNATTDKNGFLSKTDKVKLDKIENEANKITKTSQLTNDSNFLTSHQSLDGKADKNHTHSQYLTSHQSLSDYITKKEVSNNYPTKNNLTDQINTRAPKNHKSTSPDYGVADMNNYGHVKLDNTPILNSNNAVSSGGVYHVKEEHDKLIGFNPSSDYFKNIVGLSKLSPSTSLKGMLLIKNSHGLVTCYIGLSGNTTDFTKGTDITITSKALPLDFRPLNGFYTQFANWTGGGGHGLMTFTADGHIMIRENTGNNWNLFKVFNYYSNSVSLNMITP